MEELLGLAGAAASGGILNMVGGAFGLLGGWLAKKEARKMKELEFQHEQIMMDKDIAMQAAEHNHALAVADKQLDIAVQETAGKVELGELDVYAETVRQQGKMTGHIFFDGLKSSIRPLLTIILLVQLFILQYQISQLIGGLKNLDPSVLMMLYLRIIEAIIFLATTATGWWFASRRGQVT